MTVWATDDRLGGKYKINLRLALDLNNEFRVAGGVNAQFVGGENRQVLLTKTAKKKGDSVFLGVKETVTVDFGEGGTYFSTKRKVASFFPSIASSGGGGYGTARGTIEILGTEKVGGAPAACCGLGLSAA